MKFINYSFGLFLFIPSCPSGVVLIYIDNQTISKTVWFDDLFVGHYTSDVLEENHYYPFGLTLSKDIVGLTAGQPYKYQAKELEKSFGLEIYDFHARMIDPQLGKTWQPDPHADLYSSISPYSSMNNSPSNYIDPNGKDVRIGMQEDNDGNKTITLSSTIYVKGYNQKKKTADYNQFLTDNPGLLTNTKKNEDGTTTTNIEMKFVEATDEDVARVTNEETRNGDNLMLLGPDNRQSAAAFINKDVKDPVTGLVRQEQFTSFKATMGAKDEHFGSSKIAFHETMHLFGLRDWYRTVEDRYKVGFHDMMNNSTQTNTKPIMHQIHWNSWGKAALDKQQRSGTNNFILNRPVETE